MSFFPLLGAFIGFLLGVVSAYLAQNQPSTILATGAICALVGAGLFRYLSWVYERCVREVMIERYRQEQKAKEEAEEEMVRNYTRQL